MKKNKWAGNVQFREKGNTREVNVTAKECARREDIIIKEFFTIKRGLIYTVEKKGVPLGQDPTLLSFQFVKMKGLWSFCSYKATTNKNCC